MSEEVGYYNRFLGHSATALHKNLAPLPADRTLTITAYDPPYYFLRVAGLPEGDRLQKSEALEADPYSSMTVSGGWSIIKVDHEMIDMYPEIEAELLFLCYLGLAMHVREFDEYTVSPEAERLLYGERGIFRADAPPESLEEFKKYLRDVAGPAYYWRAHYLTSAFPEDIYDTQEAQWIMEDVSDIVAALNMSLTK